MSEQKSEQQERAEWTARLTEVLGLEGSPIAYAILREPPEGMKQWEGPPMWPCGVVQKARYGESFYIKAENCACPGKAFIGISPPPPKFNAADYLVQAKKLYGTRAGAAQHIQEVWKMVPKVGGDYAVFAPLEEANFDPDAVLFIGLPFHVMRIMFLDAYETGLHDVAPYGEPFCSGVLAQTISSGKMTLGMFCGGSRESAGFKPEECVLGVPYVRMRRIYRSIDKTHVGTACPDNEAGTRFLGRPDKLHRFEGYDAHLKK
ncbi:DUF169 domain-containing protein [Thermodesulfobacteriota bacterium]